MLPRPLSVLASVSAAALIFGSTVFAAAPARSAGSAPGVAAARPATDSLLRRTVRLDDGVRGRSGCLRVAVVHVLAALDLPLVPRMAGAGAVRFRWQPLFGTRAGMLPGEPVYTSVLRAPERPGVWKLAISDERDNTADEVPVITQVPFTAKQDGYVNGYRMGRWSTEGQSRVDRYAPPAGFIEVTRENQDLQISEHFRLRQFLTKNQPDVWPKYIALDLRLIDKLELVLQELRGMGIRADGMYVMSGFRTPEYNGPGGDGRAKLSRHTYGDAADVWVDSDRDGYMDDLNQDGRRDILDGDLMRRAVDRVEQRYPDLIGGVGLYHANSAHGPFVHIDVRGNAARW